MTSHSTTGYLVRKIENATDNVKDPEHSRAQAYLAKFRALELHFFDRIHPLVDAGLIAGGHKHLMDGKPPDIMTIHGCRHVSDLVESLGHNRPWYRPKKRGLSTQFYGGISIALFRTPS